MDRIDAAPEEPDPQGRVSVHDPERLDLRFRRLPRGARQGACRNRLSGAASPARRRRAAQAGSPASASRPASSQAAATPPSSRCSIPRTTPRPGWIPAWCASISRARSPASWARRHRDRAMRRWSRPWSARSWSAIRRRIRVIHADSLQRAAVEQPGRQPHGDHARRRGGGRRAQDQGHADRDRRAQSRMRQGGPSTIATAMSA